MKNKKLLITGIILLTSITIISVFCITNAYLSAVDPKDNNFTVTKDVAQISESFPEVSKQQMINEFTKEVKVKNTGTTDCFVRVYVDFSDSRVRDKAKIENGDTVYNTWADFLNINTDDWKYISDTSTKLGGYFYYKKVLPVGDTTPTLFTKVKVDYRYNDSDSNIDKITDFDIIVYSETVQTTEIDASGTVYPDNQWDTAWKSFLKISTT